ncbi:zinc finger CCCH domain-containing protein 6-like isoform X4 [Syngnathus acus]|uniref:zinc finger CCCH domain-containing protein 6-like isoform X4 n=1 Tax=Syngnathus acus TaxID=161584 RepID=UPI0018862853|nr:zinc finger CCCH domain-containing protein 6-like isoform X4 [Syngnathus acus]
MSFTNLFASLSGSDATSFTVRGDIDKVQSTTSKKRTSEGEQPGPHTKKQRNWTQASKPDLDTQDYSKSFDYHVQLTDHKNKRAGFTKGSPYNCANQVSYSGPKFQTNHNGNRQQQTKQTKQQKGRQQKRGQPQNGGGRHQTKSSRKPADRTERRNHIQNRIKTRPVKYFTEEFKEQNILLVNEQMVCRHFLHGKCIKGDNCQMQHIEPENDLVKTRCKYYMQGACMKGEKCPFMHNILCFSQNKVIVDSTTVYGI